MMFQFEARLHFKTAYKRFRQFPIRSAVSRAIFAATVLTIIPFGTLAQDFRDVNLPRSERVELLLNALTIEEKIDMICAVQPGIERLDIPAYDWWSECLHGVARNGRATVFPKPIATGSTWDEDLVKRIADAISDEARAKYHAALRDQGYTKRYEGLTYFSPTLNLARDPRWGRTDECYSEDPYLTGVLGVQFIKGLQGDDPDYLKLVATSKHFVANNEENRRLDGSAKVDMVSLREYYLPAFRMSVTEADVTSFMGAYNALNGVPCCANPFLLQQILRDEWGFRGAVISDGSAMAKIYTHHHFAPSLEAGAALALKAGCDMALRDEYKEALPKALEQGLITIADLDTATRRALELRFRLGMFEAPDRNPYGKIPESVVESAEHLELALEAARKSIILLKNDGILPLDITRTPRIALIGEAASNVFYGDYSATPAYNLTLLEALQNVVGLQAKITWVTDIESPQLIPSDYFIRPAEYAYDGLIGLTGAYYANDDLLGEPFTYRHDHTVDFERDARRNREMQSQEKLSARWQSNLTPPRSGRYRIVLEQTDAISTVRVGDQQISSSQPEINLEAGTLYPVTVESRNIGEKGSVKLLWQEVFDNPDLTPEKVAAQSDVAIVFIRDAGGAEGQDRQTLMPAHDQVELIRRVVAANPNTVVLLGSSTPLILKEITEISPALVNLWICGQGESQATAEILLGKVNPSGKTAVTFFADESQLPPLDSYDVRKGRTYQYFSGDVCYPFGYGLSYTTYNYSDPVAANTGVETNQPVTVSFEVSNDGNYAGEEVVQCYLGRREWETQGLKQKLVAFKRISLNPGERKTVELQIDPEHYARWNEENNQWETQAGTYFLRVGPSSFEYKTLSFDVR